MTTNQNLSSLRLLSAIEIAGWQIPSLSLQTPQCTAKLPALQRSAVWKPRQVEMLWDSLLRGFPVGSFLLTPFQSDRRTQDFLHALPASKPQKDPDYHLLDGQQRCNAIALGFLNSWDSVENQSAALWVDLEKEDVNDEREFVFRVLTRSHPWGYQRNDPSKTLEYKNRRKALHAYSEVFKLSNKDQNNECSFGSNSLIRHSWPWDAVCPIPFPFLVEAVLHFSENVWVALEKSMHERLPYWNIIEESDNDIITHQNIWKRKLSASLKQPTPMMDQLVECIKGLLGVNRTNPFQIPALVLQNLVTEAPTTNNHDSEKSNPDSSRYQDPVETLFIRINSAGTPLQGEELNYSILKSIWPGAQDVVQTLSTGIMAPSRLVALISRLILAKSAPKDSRPPAMLDVSRFRRLVHEHDTPHRPTFLVSVQDYLNNGNGEKLLKLARDILTLRGHESSKFRLPAVLTTDIARTSPEIFFILLVWIDRLVEAKIDPLTLDEKILRRLVGSMTALSWFSDEQSSCVQVLWKRMQIASGDDLKEFFSLGSLKDCIKRTENGKLPLIPLLPPDLLEESVEKSLYGLEKTGSTQKWRTWRWWDHFNGILPKSESARKWYSRKIKGDSDEIDYQLEAWTKFTNILWGKKEIVLYAQRECLLRWFDKFDPSSLDQLEDTDRPWDFDHIHPQKYIYGKWYIPQVIKDWHGSIGNFRAWPFELNRSDAESAPRIKLKDAGERGNRFFSETNCRSGDVNNEVLKASFISKSKDWPDWEACAPNEEGFEGNYLAKADVHGNCRVSLISAITKRWIALYREWYDELLVKDLFK